MKIFTWAGAIQSIFVGGIGLLGYNGYVQEMAYIIPASSGKKILLQMREVRFLQI